MQSLSRIDPFGAVISVKLDSAPALINQLPTEAAYSDVLNDELL
jgi:hypothetical protein